MFDHIRSLFLSGSSNTMRLRWALLRDVHDDVADGLRHLSRSFTVRSLMVGALEGVASAASQAGHLAREPWSLTDTLVVTFRAGDALA